MPYRFVTPPSVDVNIDRLLKMDKCNHKGLVSCVTTMGPKIECTTAAGKQVPNHRAS